MTGRAVLCFYAPLAVTVNNVDARCPWCGRTYAAHLAGKFAWTLRVAREGPSA